MMKYDEIWINLGVSCMIFRFLSWIDRQHNPLLDVDGDNRVNL